MNRDIGKVSECRGLWGNESKTKTVTVSRSGTMHPLSPPLTIGGNVLKESDDLDMLGVTFDSKKTFEKHLRSVSRATSQSFLSRGSFSEYSMIDCFSGDAFSRVCPARFRVLFCSVVLGCRYSP